MIEFLKENWFWIFLAVVILHGSLPWGRDTTDEPGWFGRRSGLAVYVDRATGVHYVKAGIFGGATPRLNADGTPYVGE
jgi:hypothetical protein